MELVLSTFDPGGLFYVTVLKRVAETNHSFYEWIMATSEF